MKIYLAALIVLFCISNVTFSQEPANVAPAPEIKPPEKNLESTFSLNGKTLLNDCKIALNILDQNKSEETTENMSKAMFCAGFIYGFASSESVASQFLFQQTKEKNEDKKRFDPQKHSIAFCMPFEVSNEKNVRDIVKFLENNPAYLDKPASFGVWEALKRAYPCS